MSLACTVAGLMAVVSGQLSIAGGQGAGSRPIDGGLRTVVFLSAKSCQTNQWKCERPSEGVWRKRSSATLADEAARGGVHTFRIAHGHRDHRAPGRLAPPLVGAR